MRIIARHFFSMATGRMQMRSQTRVSGLLHGQDQAFLQFALFHYPAVGIGDDLQDFGLLGSFTDELEPAAAGAVVQT